MSDEGAGVPVADARTLKTHARNLRSDSVAVKQVYDHLQAMAEEIEILAYAHPSAVMPAAPSDAVMIPLDLVRRAARVLACASTSLIADGDKTFLELNEFYNAALSQTMQPQAEPAAGEQAGAVTDAQLQALWDEACNDSPSNPGWSRHLRFGRSVARLAAPGAAIRGQGEVTAEWCADLPGVAADTINYLTQKIDEQAREIHQAWALMKNMRVDEAYAVLSALVGWDATEAAPLASRDEAPATPQHLYEIIRGTGYVTHTQAREIASLISSRKTP